MNKIKSKIVLSQPLVAHFYVIDRSLTNVAPEKYEKVQCQRISFNNNTMRNINSVRTFPTNISSIRIGRTNNFQSSFYFFIFFINKSINDQVTRFLSKSINDQVTHSLSKRSNLYFEKLELFSLLQNFRI